MSESQDFNPEDIKYCDVPEEVTSVVPQRTKSLSEKKLEKVLDIGDDLDDISSHDNKEGPIPNPEDDLIKRINERRESSALIRSELELIRTNSANNEDFAEALFKELAVTDMEILKMVRSELDLNPSPRYLETISAMSNAIVTAVQGLRDISKTKHNQEIDVKKLEVKINANNGNIAGAIAGAAISFADVIKAAKDLADDQNKIKTVDATIKEDEELKKNTIENSDENSAS